jgi:hypothetical protein
MPPMKYTYQYRWISNGDQGWVDPGGFHKCDKKRQGRERRGPDGKAFADGGGGVADRVQGIGYIPGLRRQLGHHRQTSGVIRDGAVRVHGQLNPQGEKHAQAGYADAIEARQGVAPRNSRPDDEDRRKGGHHANAQAGDYRRRRTGAAGVYDTSHRGRIGTGKEFGDNPDEGSRQKADHR